MLKKIIAAYRKHAIYRSTYNELQKLTDKELYDIGVDRNEVELIATEAAYGTETKPSFSPIFNFFKVRTEKEKIDDYLAESVSIIDLENRIKSIDKGLAPWQVRGKNYAQGLLQ